MTSRERILAAMRLEAPDRVPVTPFGLGHLDARSVMAHELIAKTDPILTVGSDGDAFLGSAVEMVTWEEGEARVTSFHTPKGGLTRKVRRTDITSATVKFPLETLDDVERFLSIPYTAPEVSGSRFHKRKAEIGDEALVMMGVADAVCLPASWFSPIRCSFRLCPDLSSRSSSTDWCCG